MAAELHITIQVGTVRQHWCNGCLTSAAYEADLWILGDDGLSSLGTAHGCDRCKTGVSAPDHQEQGET
jgi:hypothetical protein